MNPKCIMLSERSKRWFHLYETLTVAWKYSDRKEMNGCQGLRKWMGVRILWDVGMVLSPCLVAVLSLYMLNICVKMLRAVRIVHPKKLILLCANFKKTMW